MERFYFSEDLVEPLLIKLCKGGRSSCKFGST